MLRSRDGGGSPLDQGEVLGTDELLRRPSRPPDYAAESRAMVTLAQAMAASPEHVLEAVAEAALDLCRAHSAGVSLLREDGSGFDWAATAGRWSSADGSGGEPSPGDPSALLDGGRPVLVAGGEARLSEAAHGAPATEETLLVPFHVRGEVAGAIWLVSHDESFHFDAEDLRLATSLGSFASAACAQCKRVTSTLSRAEAQFETELADTKLLHSLSLELVREDDFERLLERITDAVARIMRSECTTMQLYHPPGSRGPDSEGKLELLIARGVDPSATEFWRWVRAESRTICGEALRTGGSVVWPDFEECEILAGTRDLEEYRRTGIRAARSAPLRSRDGRVLGMTTAHWKAPHEPGERESRLMDILARQAAELIERRRAEQVLRESEKRYRTLFESMREGFCVIERVEGDGPLDFRYVEVNPAFADQSGVSGVVGRTIREVVPGESEEWYETYNHVVETGDPVRFERVLAATGRVLELYAFRVEEEPRTRVGVIFRDITGRKASERALREARRRAEEANRVKGRFLAVMSHELRTPIAGVIGCARLLEEEVLGALTPEQRDAVARIKTSSWHQAEMIEEILAISRIEAGREDVRREETDIARIAGEVVALFEPEAEEKGLDLRLEGVGDPTVVCTDPAKVRRILTNLVGNAVKYTERGAVSVDVDETLPEFLRIHVRDTGPGIAPEHQESVFEPFTQVEDSPATPRSGTGLGLAICRNLARLVGGEVALASQRGEGSTFTLLLPRHPEDGRSPDG